MTAHTTHPIEFRLTFVRIGRLKQAFVAIALTLIATASIAAASAQATGTVYAGGPKLTFTAGVGDVNSLSVAFNGSYFSVTDSSSPVKSLGTCTTSGNTATCPLGSIAFLSFVLKDQDDTIDFGIGIPPHDYVVAGGAGSDVLTAAAMTGHGSLYSGGGAQDYVLGGQGDDLINSSMTDMSVIDGGGGNDVLLSGGTEVWDGIPNEAAPPGGSIVYDGSGDDYIDTTSVSGDVWIPLDDGDDTVVGGEGREYVQLDQGVDFVSLGGGEDYILRQHLAPNTPSAGDDFASGDGGDDHLLIEDAPPSHVTFDGGDGEDWVDYFYMSPQTSSGWQISLDGVANDGGVTTIGDNFLESVESIGSNGGNHAGPDQLVGNSSDNTLNGNNGSDHINGLGGSDHINGAGGNDTIEAADGVVDYVTCGSGSLDNVSADFVDVVAVDCEAVTRQ